MFLRNCVVSILIAQYIGTLPGWSQFSKSYGPYRIVVRQIGTCDDPGVNKFQIVSNKLRRYNRTIYLFTTDVIIPDDLTDEYKVRVEASTFGNGGWKTSLKNNLGGCCTMFQTYAPDFSREIFIRMGLDPPECPMRKGNYTLVDLIIDVNLKMPFIPYNKYRLDFMLTKSGGIVGCKRFYIDSVPKNSKS